MKHSVVLFAIVPALFLGACASTTTPPSTARHEERSTETEFDRTKPPRLGMSREQVRRLYGEPKYVSQTPRGETWNYTFDQWKFAIPYYSLAARAKSGVVFFDASGRVTNYNWGQSQPAIMMGL